MRFRYKHAEIVFTEAQTRKMQAAAMTSLNLAKSNAINNRLMRDFLFRFLDEGVLNINNKRNTVPLSVEARKEVGTDSIVYRDKSKFGLIYEHKVPIKMIIDGLISINDIEETYRILSSFKTAYVTKEENDRLNAQYRTSMPDGWKFGDDPNARHEAVGIRY
jgi:hypothetical protein